jgi:hypothetical protein
MTPTRQAGARAQRALKLQPLRQQAVRFRAAGRLGTAEAIEAQIARLEAAEPELWLVFGVAEVARALEGVGT